MSINLLPWREQLARRRAQRYGLLLLLIIVMIALMAIGARYALVDLKIRYQSRNLHLAELIAQAPTGDAEKATVEYQSLVEQIKLIQSVERDQKNFERIYLFLQQKLPDTMQLARLVWNSQKLILQGRAQHSGSIADLVNALEKCGWFSQVILENLAQEEQEATIAFSILATVQQPSS